MTTSSLHPGAEDGPVRSFLIAISSSLELYDPLYTFIYSFIYFTARKPTCPSPASTLSSCSAVHTCCPRFTPGETEANMPTCIWPGRPGQSKVRPGQTPGQTCSCPFVGLARGVPSCLDAAFPMHQAVYRSLCSGLSHCSGWISPLLPSELQ